MNIKLIRQELKKRVLELNAMINLIDRSHSESDDSYLWIRRIKGRSYYYVKKPSTGQRQYLGNKQKQKIKTLEQQAYCEAFCETAEKELKQIEKTLKVFSKLSDPEDVFINLPKDRTHLIKPFTPPYSKTPEIYKERTFHKYIAATSPFTTKAGEKVRSKSELIIANSLFDENIPYRYELNTVLGEDENIMTVNPDFTVYNTRTGETLIWEHFGMMDNQEYCVNALIKLENYARHNVFPGRNLITTFETSERPLNTQYIGLIIKEYLK